MSHRTSLRKAIAVLGSLGIIAVSLAGCSSSAKTGASTSTSGGHATKSALVFGNIGTYTGSFASTYSGLPKVYQAWVNYTNAHGGIDGHPVKMISMDDGPGPASAGLTDAQELIGQDHVLAIVDADGGDGSWMPYAQTAGVPVIETSQDNASPHTYTNAFPTGVTQVPYTGAMVTLAKQLGGRLGSAYCAEAAGCARIPVQLAALGLKPVVASAVSASAPNYTAFCEALKSAKVTSYLINAPTAEGINIVDQCYQLGIRAPVMTVPLNVTNQTKTDPAFNGTVVVDPFLVPYWSTSNPGIAAFRQALQQYTTGIVNTNLDNSANEQAWVASQLLTDVVPMIKGAITPSSIMSTLATLTNYTIIPGATIPVTYSNRPFFTPTYCSAYWKISNGQYVIPPNNKLCTDPAVVDPVMQAAAKSA